jgi:protein subunit release factor B
MAAVACCEKDIEETFLRQGGVVIQHRLTGIRIRCCRERSQGLNRFFARRLLVEELEAKRQNKTRHEVKAGKIREEKGKTSRSKVADIFHPYRLRALESKHQARVPEGLEKLLEHFSQQGNDL